MKLLTQPANTYYCWLISIANYVAITKFREPTSVVRSFFRGLNYETKMKYINYIDTGIPPGEISNLIDNTNIILKLNLCPLENEINTFEGLSTHVNRYKGIVFGNSAISFGNHARAFLNGYIVEHFFPPAIYAFNKNSKQNLSHSHFARNDSSMSKTAYGCLLDYINDTDTELFKRLCCNIFVEKHFDSQFSIESYDFYNSKSITRKDILDLVN